MLDDNLVTDQRNALLNYLRDEHQGRPATFTLDAKTLDSKVRGPTTSSRDAGVSVELGERCKMKGEVVRDFPLHPSSFSRDRREQPHAIHPTRFPQARFAAALRWA